MNPSLSPDVLVVGSGVAGALMATRLAEAGAQVLILKVVGGTTWHWLGSCPRFLPSDFAMFSRYGRAVDWPITYDDLEPWYVAAEHELGVAGDSDQHLGSPRSAAYPMPAIAPSYLDHVLAEALQGSPYEVRVTPQVRN